MILIWNNGEDYSDRRVVFVDCEEHTPAAIVATLQLIYDHKDGGFEIARADSLDWRAPEAVATIGPLIDKATNPYQIDERQKTLLPLVPSTLLQRVLDVHRWEWTEDEIDDVERMIRNGQLERALQASQAHLQKSPQDPQMRLLGSRIQEAQGQTGQAIATLESLTLEFPELPEPHNNLAVLYARQGRPQDALASLNRAIAARPDYTVALENLGDLYLGLALQAYQQARQTPAPSPSAARKAEALPALLSR